MANTIQLRRGSASAWTAANSVLAEGEIGVELDTNQFKIGNGTASWTELTYFSTGATGATIHPMFIIGGV